MIAKTRFWQCACLLVLTALFGSACGAGVDRGSSANSALIAGAEVGSTCTDTGCDTCPAQAVTDAKTIQADLAAAATSIDVAARISPASSGTAEATEWKSPPGTTARCDEMYQKAQQDCRTSTGSTCNNTSGYNLPYLGCICCSTAAANNAFCYCIANGGDFPLCFAAMCKDYTASRMKCFF
jgi:uncharacterized membrane protein